MKLSLSPEDLARYVGLQVGNFFPEGTDTVTPLRRHVGDALDRVERCFQHVRIKYFHDADGPCFNHLHGDQYAIFLYYLSNTIYQAAGDDPLAAKVYLLNKALHGFDAFYEVRLPEIFAVVHPVGTVLGRATYSDYFCVYHNCSVGSNLECESPVFGRGVVMFGSSRVIGRCRIGDNCLIATATTLLDTSAPDNTVSFGESPQAASKPTRRNVIRDIFRFED